MQTIRDLLKRKGGEVRSIDSQATVYRAIETMAEHNVGALVVIDDGQLVGVLSERDYLRRIELEGRQSRDTRVAQIMTTPVACANPDQSIEECMALMTDKRFRHLPVMEGTELIGVISIGDLVKHLSKEQQVEIRFLTDYIAGRVS